MSSHRMWIARIGSGFIALPLVPFGDWTILFFDGVTFLPFLVMIITSFKRYQKTSDTRFSPPKVDLVVGWNALTKESKNLIVLVLDFFHQTLGTLSFFLAAEFIRRELRGNPTHLCIWFSVTGIGALAGNLLFGQLTKRFPARSEAYYCLCLLTIFFCQIPLGRASSFVEYMAWCLSAAFFSAPALSLRMGFYRKFSTAIVPSISRVESVNGNIRFWICYILTFWTRSTKSSIGQTLSVLAAGSFTVTAILLIVIYFVAPRLLKSWFEDKDDPN